LHAGASGGEFLRSERARVCGRGFGFQVEALGERLGVTGVDEPLVAEHGLRIAGEHVAPEGDAGGQQLFRRDDAIHQAPGLGLLGRDVVARERELLGAEDADQA